MIAFFPSPTFLSLLFSKWAILTRSKFGVRRQHLRIIKSGWYKKIGPLEIPVILIQANSDLDFAFQLYKPFRSYRSEEMLKVQFEV